MRHLRGPNQTAERHVCGPHDNNVSYNNACCNTRDSSLLMNRDEQRKKELM